MNLAVLHMSSFQQGFKGNKQKQIKYSNYRNIFKRCLKDVWRKRDIFTVEVQQAVFIETLQDLTFTVEVQQAVFIEFGNVCGCVCVWVCNV